ncbi:hypothetical protein FGO68_gene10894 [Halteria grandinella]|uniref:Uncharacterized protein n=1 Tax=Halteria grandinella TaxID=5974 RepID=A0A8J8T4T6_HALGN|nr:hypothetical protein FGO68_gene10894 [Halteria grandinella]
MRSINHRGLILLMAPFGAINHTDFSFMQTYLLEGASGKEQETEDDFSSIFQPKQSSLQTSNTSYFFKEHSEEKRKSTNHTQSITNLLLNSPYHQILQPIHHVENQKFDKEILSLIFSEIIEGELFPEPRKEHLAILRGTAKCIANLNRETDIKICLFTSGDSNIDNPSIGWLNGAAAYDATQNQLRELRCSFKAYPETLINLLKYERVINNDQLEKILPVQCRYHMKQVSPVEYNILIQVKVSPSFYTRELNIIIPLFQAATVSSVQLSMHHSGNLKTQQHPSEGFPLLVWNFLPQTQHLISEIQGSIFFTPSLQGESQRLKAALEDLTLYSYDQLLSQQMQELSVESSENYQYLNKETLNIQKHFQQMKMDISSIQHDDPDLYQRGSKEEGLIKDESKIKFDDQKQSLEEVISSIKKLPEHLHDPKQTFVQVQFSGWENSGNVLTNIQYREVLFSPHREGIQVNRQNSVSSGVYKVWNSLALSN